MYQVYMTKGEYEPWWFFEDWEELIIMEETYSDLGAAEKRFRELYAEMREKYPFQRTKKRYLSAFWNEEEVYFCDSCDDDIQVYHGIMLLKDKQPLPIETE